ncbi:MAG: lysozyme inhibitor LprI family protein [Flavobacteriales bacterium]
MNYTRSLLSSVLFLTACTNPPKKCPEVIPTPKDERTLEEEHAPKLTIGEHDDQATINMNSYDETQYWKGKMNKRLATIRSIYDKAHWYEPRQKVLFFKNLEASQKAFENYVKAQIELQYPEDEWTGSGIPTCINLSYTKYYKQRYFDLDLWEKGTPDGEMCGGTALTQYELEEMKKNPK